MVGASIVPFGRISLCHLAAEKSKKSKVKSSISFENTVYFQALQLREHHEIKTTIHNQQNKEAQIFIELEKELIRFAKTTFQKKTCQKIEQGECV